MAVGSAPAAAQEVHYWTNQYGTRAELVGGLVVGTILDLSATYYNPGALSLVDELGLVVTTDAWEYQDYSFEDVVPDGIDLRANRIRKAPTLFAVQIPLGSGHRLALSTLTRHDVSISARGRRFPSAAALADSQFVASGLEATEKFDLTEGWLGVTWAHALARRFGVGATTYLSYRSQGNRSRLIVQRVDSATGGFTFTNVDEFGYWNARLFWKIGLAVDLAPLTLGATFTTPSLNLGGRGHLMTSRGVTAGNVPGLPGNELEATIQRNIGSTYQSAAAVAGGLSYRVAATTVHTTVEWFDGVDEYTVLDGGNFIGQTSGDTISIDLTHRLRSVLNWGVGLAQDVGERLHLYGAFFTDKSAFPEGFVTPMAVSTWDISHLSTGAALELGRLDFTLGVSLGWGSDTIERAIVRPEESPTAEVRYFSAKLLVGFGALF